MVITGAMVLAASSLVMAQSGSGGAAKPVAVSPALAAATPAPGGAPAALSQASPQDIFANQCAACHGTQGKGDGPAAYLVYPKPRDFTAGIFRFKSTPADQPATEDDVIRTIRVGVPHTAMPGYGAVFSDAQIAGLAKIVLSYDARKYEGKLTPLPVPAMPKFDAALVAAGKKVYIAAGCAACHGETAKGDGPSANNLKDSAGYTIPPADFTTGVFKSGTRPEDLYRTILVGVQGTPMPGFASAIEQGFKAEGVDAKTDLVWAMVAYLQSCQANVERPGLRSGGALTVASASPAMLDDPKHAAWADVKPTLIDLQTMWQRKVAARTLEVRIVKDADRLAIHLRWPDPSADMIEGSVSNFTDAAGVMLGLGKEVPSLTMGVANPGKPAPPAVNLWQWKASRQLNADKGDVQDHTHPQQGPAADIYHFKKGDMATGPISEYDPQFVSGWAAGNPNSDPALLKKTALESSAAGFGSLTLQPAAEQDLSAKGVWAEGAWNVVINRPIAKHTGPDIDLAAGHAIPIAFGVWDGAANDRNGTKLISGWHWLKVK